MKNNFCKKHTVPLCLLSIILLFIIAGGVYFYKIKKAKVNTIILYNNIDLSLTKTFKIGDLEFSYPEILNFEKNGDTMLLGHSVIEKHQNNCDFSGDHPTSNEIIDVGLRISLIDKNIYNSIKELFRKTNYSTVVLKNNIITLEPGLIDKYSIGVLDGYRIFRGKKGCGGYNYYFPISSNQTLFIYRTISSQTVVQDTDAYLLKLPGIISQDQEEQIFKDIISSIKGFNNL
ncbi:MAG: hypothetical protein JJE53_03505 [Candidatus Pacebacteria bacterium]|nr:hypothetical protein [Candidatus Paceibacterota bacterium]